MHTHIQSYLTHVFTLSEWVTQTKKKKQKKKLAEKNTWNTRRNYVRGLIEFAPQWAQHARNMDLKLPPSLPDSRWESRKYRQYVSQPRLSGAYDMEGTGQGMGKTGRDKAGKRFWRYTTYLLVGDTENTQNK